MLANPEKLLSVTQVGVTLASLGYGDILPLHPFARIVAALEGVCGLFYTAVVIARLVTSYRPHRGLPERLNRWRGMFARILRSDVHHWRERFLRDLAQVQRQPLAITA